MRRSVATVAVVVVVVVCALSGCALIGGMMSGSDRVMVPPSEFSTKTDLQTLDEALAHTDDLVQLLGGDWYDSGSPPGLFDPTDRSGWSYGPCGAAGSSQYTIHIQQVAPVADPLAKIELVREHWKGLGYQVRQIGPAEADKEKLTGIFVDLPYAAGLGFNASTQMMSISTQSECLKE